MKKIFLFLSVSVALAIITPAGAYASDSLKMATPAKLVADADNAGLILPKGFGALKVAENMGRPRHIVVSGQGDIYLKLSRLVDGKGILRLRDTNGDGKTDEKVAFGNYVGTGIAIKKDYLYASSNQDVFRYTLNDKGEVVNPEQPETIVSGLIDRGQHESKSITLDNKGNIYVNIGAFSNSCQELDRNPLSKGRFPCPILDSAGGIWQFKADQANQGYNNGIRYATGLRNVVGLDWNNQLNQLFVTQHGRDDLHRLFPDLYTDKDNAEIPAETLYALQKGDNAGWPYIYYDPFQNKKILAPEYGGDGKKEGGKDAIDPAVVFPAHLAPNALLFYTGNMFPEKYKNGAFIAFHGSWNRAPLPQEGYYVAFAPFENGKPTGKWEVFANGFAGMENITPRGAQHRPCGLAQGPDGSLYVTDDQKGTIYRILYNAEKSIKKNAKNPKKNK